MKEYYQEKIRTLTAYRSNLFTCLIVLTGGVCGIFFLDVTLQKICIFLIIGLYFGINFLINIFQINKQIDNSLGELKNIIGG